MLFFCGSLDWFAQDVVDFSNGLPEDVNLSILVAAVTAFDYFVSRQMVLYQSQGHNLAACPL